MFTLDMNMKLLSKICILQQKILKASPSLTNAPSNVFIETGTGNGWIHLSVVSNDKRLVNAHFEVSNERGGTIKYWCVELNNLVRESAVASYIIHSFASEERFKEVAPDES